MKKLKGFSIEAIAILVSTILFWVPFYFVILTAIKNPEEASNLDFSLPSKVMLWENLKEVIQSNDYMIIRAFWNSTVLTVFSVSFLVVFAAMAAYVMHRRNDKVTPIANFLVLAGLIVPPAIVPTIWVLDGLHLFKTMTGLVFVEIALHLSFGIILYRGFIGSIPRDIDEAAVIDGCGPFQLFFRLVLPLLQPVTVSVVVTNAVGIFNDFTNPLYFLPGSKNVTIQTTLYNFQSQYVSSWNLLFMDILLITLPMLLLFIVFNKKIVAGMTSGSVKG